MSVRTDLIPVRLKRRRPGRDGMTIGIASVLIGILIFIPFAFLIYSSFRTGSPGQKNTDWTLDNWEYAFGKWGLTYLGNSLLIGALTAVASVIIGVVLAWLVARTDLPGRKVLSNLFVIPLLFSPLLTTLAWIGLANPQMGLINVIAQQLFGDSGALVDIYSLPGIVTILVLHFSPYVFLAVRSALIGMDGDLEDASRALGASWWRTVRKIALPILSPAVLAAAFLVFVLAAEDYTVTALIGPSVGILTIPYGVRQAWSGFPSHPAQASALGLMLMAVAMVGVLFYLWSIRRTARFVTMSGKGGKPAISRLSLPVKIAGWVIAALYLALSVVLPYLTLILGSFSKYFTVVGFTPDLLTLEHYTDLFASAGLWTALRNTLLLVLIGATITVLLAAFVSWVSARGAGWTRRIVDFLSSMPIMIPGVALGIGLLWAYANVFPWLYGTLGLLLMAYATRYIGHGSRIMGSSLIQMNPDLENAARTLGSSRMRTFRTITLPMLRVPIASSWILIAIFISLEVPASIMLYTGSTQPVSVYLWLTMEGGVVSQAFATGTILSTLTFLVVVIAQWRFRALEKL